MAAKQVVWDNHSWTCSELELDRGVRITQHACRRCVEISSTKFGPAMISWLTNRQAWCRLKCCA